MSGMYLYCQNPECGVYLGSLGGNDCRVCEWVADPEPEPERENEDATQPPGAATPKGGAHD